MKKAVVLVVLFSLLIVFPAYADINDDLILAAKNGDTVKVKILLGEGADVNATAEYGWTALLWAAANGHTDIVRLLVDKGADVNQKNDLDWTALEYAKLKGHTEIVEFLKRHNAKE